MRLDDVDRAEEITARAYASSNPHSLSIRDPEQRQRWTEHLVHLLDTDGAGCWPVHFG